MAAVIMIGGKGMKPMKEERDDEAEGEDMGVDADEAKLEAAKALIKAIRSGDAEAAAEALQAAFEACGA